MSDILERLARCVERGKIDLRSPHPEDMKGEDGAFELTAQAIECGIDPKDVLEKGLIVGMNAIGKKFRDGEVFVPDVLMAAKSMKTAIVHLKPFFVSGIVARRGTFIIGTVSGDLHNIGKNLVAMIVEGAGWEVVDLGVDAGPQKFIDAITGKSGAVVGLSALLTSTMQSMEGTVRAIKSRFPSTRVIVGGAPVTQAFADTIGADGYSEDPQGAVEYLERIGSVQDA